tara:strand:- start:635 stop:814 length:180 start_codon:yes stop_codon:yes gene_type:complete
VSCSALKLGSDDSCQFSSCNIIVSWSSASERCTGLGAASSSSAAAMRIEAIATMPPAGR